MRRDSLVANLLGAGLDSGLAERALAAGYNLTKLRSARKTDLKKVFQKDEVETIRNELQRAPIREDVVLRLVETCDWSCCVCWKIDERLPIIIHHIEEHAKGGSDEYDNLALLCLNDHATAHSKWLISQAPVTPELVRKRKADFEKAIAEFKAGTRCAPGREGDHSDPRSQTDVQALQAWSDFLARESLYIRFSCEGNIKDFLTAMTDVIRALNTGVLKTREGDDLGRTKNVRMISNQPWRESMILVGSKFESIRARVEHAIRQKELDVDSVTGWYCIHNPSLSNEIDALRHSVVVLFNGVLHEAGIKPIRGPMDHGAGRADA